MDLTTVLEAVADEYDIYPSEITSRTRRQPVAAARQVVFYILRTTTTLTLNDIGQALGRHHATVIHGVNAIEQRRTQNHVLDARIARLVNNMTTTEPPMSAPGRSICVGRDTPLRSAAGSSVTARQGKPPAPKRAQWTAALSPGEAGSLN